MVISSPGARKPGHWPPAGFSSPFALQVPGPPVKRSVTVKPAGLVGSMLKIEKQLTKISVKHVYWPFVMPGNVTDSEKMSPLPPMLNVVVPFRLNEISPPATKQSGSPALQIGSVGTRFTFTVGSVPLSALTTAGVMPNRSPRRG